MSVHDRNKATARALCAALYSGTVQERRRALMSAFAPDAKIRLGHPFQDVQGSTDLWDRVWEPLLCAMPDLERRDWILMSGPRWGEGKQGDWVGLGGNFVGTLTAPWLGISPSDQPAFMRYQEYLRFEDGLIVEMEGLWDIPQLMKQQGVWPMADQQGVEWMCPGPANDRGMKETRYDEAKSNASVQLIWDMLHDLKEGTAKDPERGLGGFWHDHAFWYGPTGLGTARGHLGISQKIFKQFRDGLSENTRHLDDGVFFGDGNFVAFTGWPSSTAVHSGDGFMNLAPTGKRISRRSLDFWRIENNMIRECWVMIDVLDLYRQLGTDVLSDMREAA